VCRPRPGILGRGRAAVTPAPALRPPPTPQQAGPPAPQQSKPPTTTEPEPEDLADAIKVYRGSPGKDGSDGKDGKDGVSPTVDYDRIIRGVIAGCEKPIPKSQIVAIIKQQLSLYELDIDPEDLAKKIQPHLSPIHMQVIDVETGSVIDEDTQPLGGTFKLRLILDNDGT
jgi:hypothetical protein